MIYYIAEVGLAHDGSLGIAHSYIEALAKTGVNAVKFQMHIAEHESSEFEKFRINFSYEDKSRYDYWKRTSFTFEQWKSIKKHCDDLSLELIISPFSIEACNWMNKLGVKIYKIGSGEMNNYLMLDFINKTAEKVILSSGLSNYNDIKESLKRLTKIETQKISLLQCTTSYPTNPETWGLNNIKKFKKNYKEIKIGYSDHSGEIYSSLAAISLGAEIVEFHVVFDKNMFGPDSTSSLTINEVKNLVEGGNKISEALSFQIDKDKTLDLNLKNIFGKSLSINKSIKKGHKIEVSDLESKKPAKMGIPSSEYEKVLNKTVNKNLKSGDFLKQEDLNI